MANGKGRLKNNIPANEKKKNWLLEYIREIYDDHHKNTLLVCTERDREKGYSNVVCERAN